jgi:UDP-N-acetylmuramyl tripeptide synthase
MQLIALWLGKLTYFALKIIKRRGSALPGLVVEKVSPSFLARSLAKLPQGVIIVTGTNGKTTSTKMLAHILNANRRVLTNSTGSNFIRGVIATIIHNASITGKLPYDIAIIELDEAYAARFVDLFKPRGLIVTNIMRDQMDRFGEIDNTAKLIQKVVENTTEFVVLNRDDSRVSNLAKHTKRPIYYFGVAPGLRSLYLNDDELHEKKPMKSNKLEVAAELTEILGDNRIVLSLDKKPVNVSMAVSSSFNYQNAIAVCAAAMALSVDSKVIIDRLKEVKPAFGRGEQIIIGKKTLTLQLVKNPGGFRHALHSSSDDKLGSCIIAINDNYADGRDVSWLWDVDFQTNIKNNRKYPIYTSGTRAVDMALRLKYDDIIVQKAEPSLDKCLDMALKNTKNSGHLLIYTTYTAMLYLRKAIAKMTEVEVI